MPNRNNRVLGRLGARELTPIEIEFVNGGLETLTACSIPSSANRDDNHFPHDCGNP